MTQKQVEAAARREYAKRCRRLKKLTGDPGCTWEDEHPFVRAMYLASVDRGDGDEARSARVGGVLKPLDDEALKRLEAGEWEWQP
jgi:hypothetical protein